MARAELRELDALIDECVVSRARVAVEDARFVRLLAAGWELAQRQMGRVGSGDTVRREMPLRSIAAQLAVELRVNDRTVQAQMFDAYRLVTLLPVTMGALEAGRITRVHANAILESAVTVEDPRVRAAFERVAVDKAVRVGVGRTRVFARRLA